MYIYDIPMKWLVQRSLVGACMAVFDMATINSTAQSHAAITPLASSAKVVLDGIGQQTNVELSWSSNQTGKKTAGF